MRMTKGHKVQNGDAGRGREKTKWVTDDYHLCLCNPYFQTCCVKDLQRISDIISNNLPSLSFCFQSHAVWMHCRIGSVIVCLIYLFIYSLPPGRAKSFKQGWGTEKSAFMLD